VKWNASGCDVYLALRMFYLSFRAVIPPKKPSCQRARAPRVASAPRGDLLLREGVSLPATGRQYGILYPHEESVFKAFFTFPVPGIGIRISNSSWEQQTELQPTEIMTGHANPHALRENQLHFSGFLR
jgi:hypothetical protein